MIRWRSFSTIFHSLFIKFRRWTGRRLVIIFIIIIISSILITINISTNNEKRTLIKHNEVLANTPLEKASNEYYSLLSPELQWCSSNPFLADFNRKNVMNLERKWLKWNKNQFLVAYNVLFNHASSLKQIRDQIVKLAYPISSPLPCPTRGGLKWYGTGDETGKALCAIDKIKNIDRCVIYSLGSNNEFDFERDLSTQTSCEIHTYDCTSFPPREPIERLSFYKLCLGKKQKLQNYIFPQAQKYYGVQETDDQSHYKSYQSIITKNNHTEVHILKMDIEGGEYSVFADLFKQVNQANLPYQISFESHWWDRDIYHAIMHQQIFSRLWKYGYRFMHHEINPAERSCVEWTLLRVFC